MLTLALAATMTLTWTAPNHDAPAPRRCGVGTNPCADLAECIVYRQRQSATWVAMRPAMQLDGDVWAATWPSVRTGAAPVVYARIPLDPNTDAGRVIRFTVTDTTSTTWFYFVTVTNEAAKVSRQSNEVGK